MNRINDVALLAALVVSVVLLTGCTADSDSVQGADKQGTGASAIAFAASTDAERSATRTAQGTITLDGAGSTVSLQSQGFGVFACHTGLHPYISTSTTTNLLYNQLVSYDALSNAWTYAPQVYWPNSSAGVPEYATFFAYAPHSDNAAHCIVDMSRYDDKGDPWILYQLGGTKQADGADGWKAKQVDLLYDFLKDKMRGATLSTKVKFDFKHALACVGDRIVVSCHESITDRLRGVYTNSTVEFTVTSITIDYLLTRKGRLVLNNNTQPNWQAVDSEDAKVHRTLTFTPNQVLARATSSLNATSTTFDSGDGHGIFYIPIESGNTKQQATITAQYTITSGDPAQVVEEGSVSTVVDLSFVSNANQGRNLNITLRIPQS